MNWYLYDRDFRHERVVIYFFILRDIIRTLPNIFEKNSFFIDSLG